MSTWSLNPQFYLVFIVHATLIMGRQLKAYDDCGHKLHMVFGANNVATESDRECNGVSVRKITYELALPLLVLKRWIVSGSDR